MTTKKETTKPTSTLFENLYNQTDCDRKRNAQPLIEKKLKRQLDAAHDDAESKTIVAEEKMDALIADFANFDINAILKLKQEIDACVRVQKDINDLHVKYFNVDL